jgi:predicted RNA-binding Zn ribbon-like protein
MASDTNAPANGDHPFYFVGNLLCLDFVNTEIVSRGERVDLFTGFADLIRWLQDAALLTAAEARSVENRWGDTSEGNTAFKEAVSLRGALRDMADRLVAGKSVDRNSIEQINRLLATRPTYLQLELKANKFASRHHTVSESARHFIVPVAESAVWLLEQGDISLLRKCENPECILFFYDTTKNKRRRWCSMDACGSRAKAAAYYRRSHPPKRKR